MALRLTLENLRQMTDELAAQRQENLHDVVHSDVHPPEMIVQKLQDDLKKSIEKGDNQTQFTYTIASYYRIYHKFGKRDAYPAIVEMAIKYRDSHFPMANISVSDWKTYSQTDGVDVLLHFTLPWLSDQTNSRPPPT